MATTARPAAIQIERGEPRFGERVDGEVRLAEQHHAGHAAFARELVPDRGS